MTSFSLVTFLDGDTPRPGLLVGDRVADLVAARLPSSSATGSLVDLLGIWDAAQPALSELAERVSLGRGDLPTHDLKSVRLCAPLLYPGAIFCAAANYTDHMKEMNPDRPIPDKNTTRPYFFTKSPRHTVIGPGEPIRLPATSTQIDWEAEIGVVIGRVASRVSVDQAMSHVAGYTILNDLSARDLTPRTDWRFGNDWFRGKSFDTAAPMGPWITPASEVPDPHRLGIRLWVNDELKQDSSSTCMLFTIPEQIAYLSEQLTLQPGDVIATGTPAGVGRPRGTYLERGDRVRISIECLGTLENHVA